MVRLTDHLNMTIAVDSNDWDVKPQTKQNKTNISENDQKI